MHESDSSRYSKGETIDALYSFWEEMPRIAFINVGKEVIESHPARRAILRILRDGVQDDLGTTDSHKIRRAMNADEIRDRIKAAGIARVSKTGMYFHLGVLEEAGLIKVVSRILEGRHKVAYYGRVARHLLVTDPETRLQKYERLFGTLSKFTKALVPEGKAFQFKGLPKKFLEIKVERERRIGEWLIDNENLISKLGIELDELFEALKVIDACGTDYVELLGNLHELLQIP